MDSLADFEESKKSYESYPKNLVRTEAYSHGLELYLNNVMDQQYFDQQYRLLYLWDLIESNKGFKRSPKLNTLDDAVKYTDTAGKDPLWRFIFLQSRDSRSPVGCTRKQLQFLLTYHQVMPSFLDFVFLFKGRENALAQAIFRHENYLEKDSPKFNVPTIGRSSVLVQHAFNILSVEKPMSKRGQDQITEWPLRHATVYHAFDLQNGRALWAVLKGNNIMGNRIKSAIGQHKDLKPDAMSSPERSFVASLHIHMIALEWCAENWGQYIDHLGEQKISKSIDSKIATVTALTRPESLAQAFPRTSSGLSRSSSTFNRRDSISRGNSSAPPSPTSSRTLGRSWSDLLRHGSGFKGIQPEKLPEEGTEDGAIEEKTEVWKNFDMKFSFEAFQGLSMLGDEMEEAIIVIQQNKEVISEIRAQYKMVLESWGFKENIKREKCEGVISIFFRRLRSIDRELDMHLCRLRALSRAVEKDKAVLDVLFQYKSAKTSEYFTKCAKDSSDRMEEWTADMHKIAIKTEQETASMHLVTIFTLIFLPGTFLATFFSSGVLHWNEEDPDLGSDWVVRSDGMRLFFSICAPMMVVILAGWAAVWLRLRRQRQKKDQRPSEATHGYADEKGNNTMLASPTGTGSGVV